MKKPTNQYFSHSKNAKPHRKTQFKENLINHPPINPTERHSMKRAYKVAIAVIVVVTVLSAALLVGKLDFSSKPADAFVGVAYCGNSVADGKTLIEKVKSYTNLFVLQSGLLQRDFNSVNELGDYAVASGMYFLPYFGNYVQASFSSWLDDAKQRWGDHFLGVYYSDEAGGKMLDDYVDFVDPATGDKITKTEYGDVFVQQPNGVQINYDLNGVIHLYEPAPANSPVDINSEATFYPNGTVIIVNPAPNGFSYNSYQQLQSLQPFKDINETAQRFIDRDQNNIAYLKNNTKVFTSDYALYWFDYLSGYDVVLGKVGWNLTLNQQIALNRGAAQLQNKEWGVVITWKYQEPPYLDNGTEILSQMRTAYECGAKYIVLFDYYDSDSGALGTLQPEHFQALHSFWNNVIKNPSEIKGSIKADSVLVLPHNYGWGTRWEEDKVWGIFKADNQTRQIWNLMQTTLQEHGLKTDIVYDDSEYPLSTHYDNVFYCK
jgi:hypothetical protein